MLLYCTNSVVVATHDDAQVVAPDLYGPGIRVIPMPNGTALVPVASGRGPPWVIPAPTVEILIAYAADKRWRTAIKGTTVAGIPLLTDDGSQAKIAQVKQAFDSGTILSTTFKGASGNFVTVNAAQMTALYAGVVAHVQACYAAEALAAAAVNAGTALDYAAVDMFFSGIA
jgi:hypothetical protein